MTLLAIALALTLGEEIKVEVVSVKLAPNDERTIRYDGRSVHAITTLNGQISGPLTDDIRLDSLPKWVEHQAYDNGQSRGSKSTHRGSGTPIVGNGNSRSVPPQIPSRGGGDLRLCFAGRQQRLEIEAKFPGRRP